jgi:Lanthionine-containing peptide SapB precursor RamS
MSVMDLQGMEVREKKGGGAPAGSRTSKGCGVVNQSNVSLILCILVL